MIDRRSLSLGLMAATVAAPIAARAQEVQVRNANALEGVTRVVVGGFVVAFLTDRTDTSRAGGGLLSGGFGGRSTARSALEGVSDTDFQAATDAAYTDLLNQIQTAGYQLADRTPWVEAMSAGRVSPGENGRERGLIMARDSRAASKVFSPTGLGGPMIARESVGHIMDRGIGDNTAALRMSMSSEAFARESGQAVLNAFYVVDFASAETYGGWFRNSSAVSVQAGLALVPELSMLVAYAPSRRVVTAILKQPVAVGGDFGTFSDTTSSGSRAAQVGANVIGILGGVGTSSTRRYTLQAVSERWTAGAGELLTSANARLIQALRTGR